MARDRRHLPAPEELLGVLKERLRPPFGIILGAPGEAARLAAVLGEEVTAYQMDLHPAERLREALAEQRSKARVETAGDLWDLPSTFQTLIYPAPRGGERELKIDMVEQAYHVLRPRGLLVVLSPYPKDDFFPALLKKVFGRVHIPLVGRAPVFWCQRDGDRPRRRHEVTFQVRFGEGPPLQFLSRPGTFAYGRFDDGARALVSLMEVHSGERVLDIGCGCGTNGICAGRLSRPEGQTSFVDSNLRALELARFNAQVNGLVSFQTTASSRVDGLPEEGFDVALANPPYFAQGTIAGLFIVRARALLRPGGRLYVVTRQPHEVGTMLQDVFGQAEAVEKGGYTIFTAQRFV